VLKSASKKALDGKKYSIFAVTNSTDSKALSLILLINQINAQILVL